MEKGEWNGVVKRGDVVGWVEKRKMAVSSFFSSFFSVWEFFIFLLLVHVISIINFPSAASSIVARIFLFE